MKILYILVVLTLAINVLSNTPHKLIFSKFLDKSTKELFKVFHTVYKKNYELSTEEAIKRYKVFKQNLKHIKETNAKGLSYNLGINQFADLTREEFKQKYLTFPNALKKQMGSLFSSANIIQSTENYLARSNIDWKGLFSTPRDQSDCGSCWAFTTVGVLEANWWKANQSKDKVVLSPQQLVDCDTGNGGCNGGWYEAAYNYVIKNGLVEEKNYPYNALEGTCKIPSTAPIYKMRSFNYCDNCSIDQWWNLFQKGPIAIAVDAEEFQFYDGGIMNLDNCGEINHAIIAIGWAIDSEGEVLTIRNSWGQWGEQGNMRIRVNFSNQTCNTLNYAYLPLI